MKQIIIDGRTYNAELQPFMGDLKRVRPEFGYGYGTVVERVGKIDFDNVIAFLDDDEATEALTAWVWMLKLRHGERDVTRADAEMVALDQMQLVPEPADESGDDAAPTPAPTGSGRGDDEGKGTSKLRSTTPSKKPSTAA